RYAKSDPVVSWYLWLTASLAFFVRPYVFLLPAFAVVILGSDATGLSALMSASGLGALAGSFLVAPFGAAHRRERAALIAGGMSGLGLILLAAQREFWLAVPVSALLGAATILSNGLTTTILQTAVPDRLRGRVMSIFTIIFAGIMPLGQTVLG